MLIIFKINDKRVQRYWERHSGVKDHVSHLAYHDRLTGLPNRSLFLDRLHQAVIEADRREKLVAVMFLDLDRFKQINDNLGHRSGDLLLVEAGKRLSSAIRAGDTVARLGGDEFTIVLADLEHINHAITVAEKILSRFSRPFDIENQELFVTSSIGITLYPLDDSDSDGLLKNADTAMYHAKKAGRNNYHFYSAEMTAQAKRRLTMEQDLRNALQADEFELQYQPVVDLKENNIVGIEALLRWRQPKKGVTSTENFIKVAEETGLIVPIGEWVIRTACQQTKSLQLMGFQPIQLSLNLSLRQLRDNRFLEKLRANLIVLNYNPKHFEVEVSERLLMEDFDRLLDVLRGLIRFGVKISIDNFGVSFSSLRRLKCIPVDKIKIDKSLISDLSSNKENASIVEAIIKMAHSLGFRTIAQGVETKEQLDILTRYCCDQIQGNYFSQPVSADALAQVLRDKKQLKLDRSAA